MDEIKDEDGHFPCPSSNQGDSDRENSLSSAIAMSDNIESSTSLKARIDTNDHDPDGSVDSKASGVDSSLSASDEVFHFGDVFPLRSDSREEYRGEATNQTSFSCCTQHLEVEVTDNPLGCGEFDNRNLSISMDNGSKIETTENSLNETCNNDGSIDHSNNTTSYEAITSEIYTAATAASLPSSPVCATANEDNTFYDYSADVLRRINTRQNVFDDDDDVYGDYDDDYQQIMPINHEQIGSQRAALGPLHTRSIRDMLFMNDCENLGIDTSSLDDFTTVATTDAFSVQFVEHSEHDVNTPDDENERSFDTSTASQMGESLFVTAMYLEQAEAELSEQGRTSGSDAYMIDRKYVKRIKSKNKKRDKCDSITVAYAIDGSNGGKLSSSNDACGESASEAAPNMQREIEEDQKENYSRRARRKSNKDEHNSEEHSNIGRNGDESSSRRRKKKIKSRRESDDDVGTISEEERRELQVRLRRKAKEATKANGISPSTSTGATGGGGKVVRQETTDNENLDTSNNRCHLTTNIDVEKLPKSRRYRALEKAYKQTQQQLASSNSLLKCTMEQRDSLEKTVREQKNWNTTNCLMYMLKVIIVIFLICFPLGEFVKRIKETPGLITHPDMRKLLARYYLLDEEWIDEDNYNDYIDYIEKHASFTWSMIQNEMDSVGDKTSNQSYIVSKQSQSKLEALLHEKYAVRERYRIEKDLRVKREEEIEELKKQIDIFLEYQNEVHSAGKTRLCQATHNKYADELDQYSLMCSETVEQLQRELFYYKASYKNLASKVSTDQLQKPLQPNIEM